jgi:predicted helicase
MMAPYAVAHMKIAMVLKDTGYDFSCSSRLNVYLTNTLEEPGSSEAQMTLFDDPLALESVEANVVKKNSGINVIIGNPPYSTESSNKGEWISDLMNLYKKEPDGITKLKERNSKPLNDDYIKFIRYGQYILKKSNRGILAFINPHGFTDGPIYRGMRSALLRDFDTIYILDLHGNANRQERALDGGKDENVFDIKQGVCIVLLVKNSSIKKKAKVYRGDLYGTRDAKYRYLQESTLSQIDWTEIVPSQPLNLFCREDASAKNSYEAGISIRDLFDVNGTGILTKRDQLCIQFNPEAAFEAAEAIATKPKEEVTKKYCVADDVRDWKYEWAKADVLRNKLNPDKVMKITYRPFDDRYTYYTGESRGFMGWPVYSVMQHMMNKNNNIALVTARSNKAGNSTHFFVSRNIVEYKCGERTTNSSVFPLYNHEDGAFDATPNFKEVALREIEKRLGLIHSEKCANPDIHFSAYDLFAYIYAIFYSPSFRDANKDFINRDFPVVPYPATTEQFWKLSELGNRLIKAHLLEDVSTKTQVSLIGIDTIVQKVDYKNGRVYINNTSYFDNIEEETWSFIIGGYQPCQRWLKERKCVMLMEDDVTHYEMLVEAINQTRVVMGLIDREI